MKKKEEIICWSIMPPIFIIKIPISKILLINEKYKKKKESANNNICLKKNFVSFLF